MIDCLLLSKANVLIRTVSNLNEFSAAWNLDLKVVTPQEQEIKHGLTPLYQTNFITKEWILNNLQ